VATRSCGTAVGDVAGAVVTIEGLGANGDHPLQKAWAAANVPQCGYCQPGQIMAAAALLKETPKPSDEDIEAAMSNICRCGTYTRIKTAVKQAAEAI
jgi:isoquinoline 1-oxidoreductase alpha subunit